MDAAFASTSPAGERLEIAPEVALAVYVVAGTTTGTDAVVAHVRVDIAVDPSR